MSNVYTPGKLPSNDYAYQNAIFLHPEDFQRYQKSKSGKNFVIIKNFVLELLPLDKIDKGQFAASSLQKDMMRVAKIDSVEITKASSLQENPFSSVELLLDLVFADPAALSGTIVELSCDEVGKALEETYKGKFLNFQEQLPLQVKKGQVVLKVTVVKIESLKGISQTYGQVTPETIFRCTVVEKSKQKIKMTDSSMEKKQLFKSDFNFQSLGIGGLDKEFAEIFRRAFNTRRYPQSVIEKYGMKHCKGMILYGPPGTGKTLIARKIAEVLNCKEPKVVNGPEIFDKFVGGSEKNIRDLFADAESDQATNGDESELHVIIFDEIDAICRKRGSTNSGTGVNESVVNQLLSKIDGVDSLNNILIIGMTNRLDMIDEALLRPGRFEIHLEIGLPDEPGRKQIFTIHTQKMKKNDLLTKDVDLDKLAAMTKNYTGAEIEAVCGSARSFALFSGDVAGALEQKMDGKQKLEKQLCMNDFIQALDEVKPAFGMDNKQLDNCVRGGFFIYGKPMQTLFSQCKEFIKSVKNSKSTTLLTVLIEGVNGSGKTALAAKLAMESDFLFVKMISPEQFVGKPDFTKVAEIVKVFDDAYKSDLSLIILDDIERLIEFIHIGSRFSNLLLQTLLILIKKKPPNHERKLMIIGTTAQRDVLADLDIIRCFNVTKTMCNVTEVQELTSVLSNYQCNSQEMSAIADQFGKRKITEGVPIKKLLLATELAIEKSSTGNVRVNNFMESLDSVL